MTRWTLAAVSVLALAGQERIECVGVVDMYASSVGDLTASQAT